jgi:hypothetical protein
VKKNFLSIFIIFVIISNVAIFAGCNVLTTKVEIENYAILFCNDIMSKKLNKDFSADISKELYDFTGNSNYLLCYDSSLDYYAIMNMDSGSIMERSNGQVYDGYLDYKCYYGGYSSYFYEKDDIIYGVKNTCKISVDDAILIYKDYSENIVNSSIAESQFKSREEIKLHVEKYLSSKDNVIISKCSASNRGKAKYSDNLPYNMLILCNSMYTGAVESHDYCYVDAGGRIGFAEFDKYDGGKCMDTLFPININGTCGIVSATMLLQYYERNRIFNTIPDEIYARATKSLTSGNHHSRIFILTEILHDIIKDCHNNFAGGSTYVTVKDALNKYFAEYSISGISATSSASWWGLKSAIDEGDPCILFVPTCTVSVMNNDLESFSSIKLTQPHAMYTYGYTLTGLNIVDEYICHGGMKSTEQFYSMVYVSKTLISGNVRLLY